MSATEEFLFIGGYNDGKWIRVDPTSDTLICSKPPMKNYTAFVSKDDGGINDMEVDMYTRRSIQGSQKTFRLMALKGMTGDDIVGALIGRYIPVTFPLDEYN